MKKIYFITYHYVRKIKKSKYPNLKGLEIDVFKSQLDKINKKFDILNFNSLLNIFKNKEYNLKRNACVLTFDDGYKDNIKYVLPELKKRNLSGFFFPSVESSLQKKVLDVNKIQFILEAEKSRDKILKIILNNINGDLKKKIIKEKSFFINKHPYDDTKTSFIKHILQSKILKNSKKKMTNSLFNKIVTMNEGKFAKELYLSKSDIKKLFNEGMHIGCHGANHLRLNELSNKQAILEVNKNIKFLKKIGVFKENWIMCYPYGAYDAFIKRFLKKKKCFLGLTTNHGYENNIKFNNLEIKRIDCNLINKII